jgi:peptidyl-dipeptidase Dcp
VLDADSVEWFKQNGGLTRKNGQHFRDTLLSQGGSQDAMKIFKDYTGREPYIEPLLVRRGLTTTADDSAKPGTAPNETPPIKK